MCKKHEGQPSEESHTSADGDAAAEQDCQIERSLDLEGLLKSFEEKVPRWSVETLRQSFAIPCEAELRGRLQEVPFPANRTVGDITEKDVRHLQTWLGLRDRDKYSYWRNIYFTINMTLAGRWQDSERILSWTRRILPRSVPFAPVFLLLSEAHLSQHDKTEQIDSGAADSHFTDTPDLELTKELQSLFHRENVPTTRRDVAHGESVKKACAGLIALLKKHWDAERGHQTKALHLFSAWGIAISPANVRDWRRMGYDMP